MRLIINIPCYNEEKTLPLVLEELPKEIPGIAQIDVQVIDDGSTDRTVEVARQYGCRVISHKTNRGLGNAFKTGVQAALEDGYDIMVNTDADNQYPARYIPQLVQPVLAGQADIVIGNREPWKVAHFSPFKRFLQYVGNGVTRTIAGSDVPDTISGFRVYSAEALLRINITTKYSYTLDTIVQASRKGLKIVSLPIETNPPTRKSRLFKNAFQHVANSISNIVTVYAIYQPFQIFSWAAAVFAIPALILLIRFLYFYVKVGGVGHVQSLVVSAIGFSLAGILFSLGVFAGLISINRRFIEEILYLEKKHTFYEELKPGEPSKTASPDEM